MKKILLLIAVFAFVGTSAIQAQCTKSKTAATTKKACSKTAAVKVADATPGKVCAKSADAAMMQDRSIVKKVSDAGEVSYARKKTCAASGKVSYADVKYCSDSKVFVNVAPAMDDASAITVAGAEKKACSKADKKACSKSVAAALTANPDVEKRTCAASGKVSYVKKSTCAASGKVSYADVKYCSDSKAFVNVAPAMDDASAITVAGAEKKACSKADKKACSKSVAAALTANPDVEKRTCAASGKVSYMKKSTCAASGKVAYNEVKYCSDSKKFVNAAPAKKSCTAAEKAACSKGKAKGVSLNADGTKKKACSKPCAKTCTKGAKAQLKSATEDVKVIKTSNQ